MSRKYVTEKERALFIVACKNNGIVVSKAPQKRMRTATIITGEDNISVSRSLTVKKARRKTVRKIKPVRT